jgi:beta-lactamase superfamily II metal-dependent hydrolase
MGAPASVPADRLATGDFAAACRPTDLVYFLVNVGDGDAQLIVLPEDLPGNRQAIVVDVSSARKVIGLVDQLEDIGLLPRRPAGGRFPIVVGTHPHGDHIGGMAAFVRRFRDEIGEYWQPGYYLPTKSFLNTQRELEPDPGPPHRPGVPVVLPTSGTVRYLANTAISVLAPSVALRNRFDTYGVEINDASITLMVEYPANRVVEDYEQVPDDLTAARVRRRLPARKATRLLFGADAQTASWSHVAVDFPALRPSQSWIARELHRRRGADHLRADIFKIPHHASKHGVNLELVERVAPKYCLVSSVGGGGSYNFPHTVALDMIREARQAIAASGASRSDDWDLGIHYTAGTDSNGTPLGTIGVIVGPRRQAIQLWRFGDAANDLVSLMASPRRWVRLSR